MKVLIDADSCPKKILDIVLQFKGKYNYRVITVASFNHNISSPEHIMVGDEYQAADMAIINRTDRGDIVVTADWGLASLILGKGAKALSPSGYIYNAENIDFKLEERHFKEKIRRSGGRTKGPSKRSREDDERFKRSFLRLVKKS